MKIIRLRYGKCVLLYGFRLTALIQFQDVSTKFF